ncbi:MAG: O-antigen ligase family protein [Rubrivivax sp.]|nr:O-antigen ligase family protein [Rubrivivax sp.]
MDTLFLGTQPAVPPTRASLPFTDTIVVALLGLVFLVALDPFAMLLLTKGIGRWGPFFLAMPILAMAIYGRLYKRQVLLQPAVKELWSLLGPAVVFASWVLAGSLWGRWVRDNDHTFLPMGLFALVGGPVTAALVLTSAQPERMLRAIAWTLYLLAAFTLGMTAIVKQDVAVFHSVEFLVFPVLAWPLLVSRHPVMLLLGLLGPIAAALALDKLTGYLVMLIVFAMLAAGLLRQRLKGLKSSLARVVVGYWAVLAALASLGLVVLTYYLAKGDLPSGNARYRLYTYGKAIDRFQESPIWGQLFASPPVERFELFTVAAVTQVLPTHNDSLDILAHGGVIGAALFFFGLGVVLFAALKALLDDQRFVSRPLLRAQLALHTMVVACAIPVFTLNPVLNTNNRAWSFWIHVALIVALVMISRRRPGFYPQTPAIR